MTVADFQIESAKRNADRLLNKVHQLRVTLREAYTRIAHLEDQAKARGVRIPLLDRRAFFEEVAGALAFGERYAVPMSVVVGNIQNFSVVNDRYGFEVGDGVLDAVTERMRSVIRQTDLLGRIGDDVFCVLLWNTNVSAAGSKAQEMQRLFADLPVMIDGHAISIGLSVGAATANANDAPQDLIDRAA